MVQAMRNLVTYGLLPALIGGVVGLLILAGRTGEVGPAGYADAVARAAPSVVNIYSSKTMVPPICEMPRYHDWCEAFRLNRASRSLGDSALWRAHQLLA